MAFLLILACGGLARRARAATGDIFINTVTPHGPPVIDAHVNVMPTIGNRRDVLYSLRVLQARQIQALAALDHLAPDKLKLPANVAQRKELKLRRKFYDLVIFSVDTKWTDKPLREFLEAEFISRAQNDINSDDSDKDVANDSLWRFFTYLSVAIRDLPEPREDLVSFIQGYIDFSTISKPRAPADYVAQRAYSNGIVSQAAHTRPIDEIGDGVERLVRARGLDKSARRVSASHPGEIELRMKSDLPAPPPPEAVSAPTLKN